VPLTEHFDGLLHLRCAHARAHGITLPLSVALQLLGLRSQLTQLALGCVSGEAVSGACELAAVHFS